MELKALSNSYQISLLCRNFTAYKFFATQYGYVIFIVVFVVVEELIIVSMLIVKTITICQYWGVNEQLAESV